MNTIVSRALWGTLLAGGITLLGATVAQAAETTGDDGLLSGTQAPISLAAPITSGGDAAPILGDATSTDAAPSASDAGSSPSEGASTSGLDGILSGTQALLDVAVPVTVGGNAVSVLGDAESTDATTTAPEQAAPEAPAAEAEAAPMTSGDDSIGGGTQAIIPISVPVTIGGNAVSVLGDATSTDATTTGGATAPAATGPASTSGEDSILGGTQLIAPISLPITIGGNAVAIVGDARSSDA